MFVISENPQEINEVYIVLDKPYWTDAYRKDLLHLQIQF